MKKVAIIGAGVSGLTMAHLLKDRYIVSVFEKEDKPGGLIRCNEVKGNLFHLCGGHVFNTKDAKVEKWFWSFFDRETEFVKARRNSAIQMTNGGLIPYPIEDHIYYLDQDTQNHIIEDWLKISELFCTDYSNFEEFLKGRFGETLYKLYFKPYNEKIWKTNLKNVPIEWLAGKLPMPTVQQMFLCNINHQEDSSFVHSSFYYERRGGSQLIADKLAKGINVKYNSDIKRIKLENNGVNIEGVRYDLMVFCGNIKQLVEMISDSISEDMHNAINDLAFHGTTSVFCELEKNPYSWIYQPDSNHGSHRIICTGNFSPANNTNGKLTGTVEFTDITDVEEIKEQLKLMPFSPQYITYHYSKYSYPIQNNETRDLISELKKVLLKKKVFLTGRFADWEYYNMDAAIGAAMRCANTIWDAE